MTPTIVIEFDEAELVVRMHEAFSGSARPPDCSAEAAIEQMAPEMQQAWLRVMKTIRDYWDETVFDAKSIQ